ncbi:hypothetical protein Tco_0606431, partial [Tanacetum coccineum]
LMAHRILRDVEAEADGWERSDFPIIYATDMQA